MLLTLDALPARANDRLWIVSVVNDMEILVHMVHRDRAHGAVRLGRPRGEPDRRDQRQA